MRRAMAVRVVSPLQWVFSPALAVAGLTIVLAAPIRIFSLPAPEPVLPLVLAFAWPLIRPSVLGPLTLAALGLLLDQLWGGLLGLWPLALLTVYGMALASRAFLSGQATIVLFGWYAAACGLAFLIVWLVVAAVAGTAPNLMAVGLQLLPTLLLFPAANALLERFDDGDVRFR